MESFNADELNLICRLCLQQNKELVDIYKNQASSHDSIDMELHDKISACVSIEVSLYNHEPKRICVKCLDHINAWYNFKMSCNTANSALQEYLRDIQGKNMIAISATRTIEDSLLFPEISLLSCDTLLEKSMSLQSNISSIVNYFFPSDEKENKAGTDDLCQQIGQFNSQISTLKTETSQSSVEKMKTKSKTGTSQQSVEIEKMKSKSGTSQPSVKMKKTKSKSEKKGYHCKLCNRTFSHFSLFLSHDENVHSTEMRKYSCSICERLFILKDRLRIHMKLVHREKTHQCPICDKFFASEKSLKVHSRLHSEKYKCNICEYVSTSKLYLSQHMQRHEGVDVSFNCDICQQRFSQKSSLLRHIKLHSENHGKCFKCKICCLLFRSNSELVSHKNMHYGTNTPKTHKCRTCSKVFSSRKTLIVHEKIHQERQFNCNVCEKKFISSYDLQIHMETHSDNKRFICFHCDKKFSVRKSLMKHLKTFYPRVRSDVIL